MGELWIFGNSEGSNYLALLKYQGGTRATKTTNQQPITSHLEW